ncbi:MAG: hypothetical protein LBN93_08135 [Candidatus Symbiothrix sp.]|jgi:hypothetical protein|nr:hypothetical protein [Candidatus Symbiothrix sp.]
MKQFLSCVFCLLSFATLQAQTTDAVLMTVNGKDVKKSEFEYSYTKNNGAEAIDKRSEAEYRTLFQDLKLKVAEAETQGLDTTAAFRKEWHDYRSQLIKSYNVEQEGDSIVKVHIRYGVNAPLARKMEFGKEVPGTDTLFLVEKQAFFVNDFKDYLQQQQIDTAVKGLPMIDALNDYLYQNVVVQLTPQFPELPYLLQEYRDGSLSFEITQQEVWEKAALDTDGLTKFFNKNKSKYSVNGKKPKTYTEVRGQVITDYQDFLEKEWLQQLRKKYTVTSYQLPVTN